MEGFLGGKAALWAELDPDVKLGPLTALAHSVFQASWAAVYQLPKCRYCPSLRLLGCAEDPRPRRLLRLLPLLKYDASNVSLPEFIY